MLTAFASLTLPQNRVLAEAWASWRDGAVLPRRSAVRLEDLKPVLDKVSLVEVYGPDDMRIRVAGTGLRGFVGFELTGTSYRDITPPEEWPTRSFRVLAMVGQPCGGLSVFDTQFVGGGAAEIELLTLPVADDSSGQARFIIAHAGVRTVPLDMIAPPGGRQMRLADAFRYLDIGRGIPAATAPGEAGGGPAQAVAT